MGSTPGSGRLPGVGNGNPSRQCLGNPMDRVMRSQRVGHKWAQYIQEKECILFFIFIFANSYFFSVQFSHSVVSDSLRPPWTEAHQASLYITNLQSPPKPMSIKSWCHPTTSPSVIPFSSCPQSFPASGSFQMSQLFASGGQSIGVSASTSILPMNNQDWFPLGWTGWISWQSKGLLRVFSSTTVQKHHFFGAQVSL